MTYTVSAETRILPYLTRNIVTADDLEAERNARSGRTRKERYRDWCCFSNKGGCA
ncbi:MAG: hypothetical protein ACLR8P_01120 [Clostridium fessum]